MKEEIQNELKYYKKQLAIVSNQLNTQAEIINQYQDVDYSKDVNYTYDVGKAEVFRAKRNLITHFITQLEKLERLSN